MDPDPAPAEGSEDGAGRLSRRVFLVSGAAAASGLIAACHSDRSGTAGASTTHAPTIRSRPRPDPGARRRAVVVGAGLAGLTAALDLRDAGWDVVVVEARDRVGGRVHTLRRPFSSGLHAEGGGESVDDNHHALLALVRRFGLRTERRDATRIARGVVYLDGRRRDIPELTGLRGGRVAADYARVSTELLQRAEREGIDPAHPERAARAEQLDRTTLADFFDGLHLVPEAQAIASVVNRSEYNAELADLSLLFVLQQTAVVADVPDSAVETMRISGGNQRLAEAMAADLGRRVRLGAAVERIAHRADGVTVSAGGRDIHGAHLVLAVPPRPLRDVRFDPPLPASVAAMISGLDLGGAAKVITEYRRPFWLDGRHSGLALTDVDLGVVWAATDSYRTDAGILTSFITGRAGRRLANVSPTQRIAHIRRQMARLYPEAAADETALSATTAWAAERYTGGGYAAFRPGQITTLWPCCAARTAASASPESTPRPWPGTWRALCAAATGWLGRSDDRAEAQPLRVPSALEYDRP